MDSPLIQALHCLSRVGQKPGHAGAASACSWSYFRHDAGMVKWLFNVVAMTWWDTITAGSLVGAYPVLHDRAPSPTVLCFLLSLLHQLFGSTYNYTTSSIVNGAPMGIIFFVHSISATLGRSLSSTSWHTNRTRAWSLSEYRALRSACCCA